MYSGKINMQGVLNTFLNNENKEMQFYCLKVKSKQAKNFFFHFDKLQIFRGHTFLWVILYVQDYNVNMYKQQMNHNMVCYNVYI